MKAPNTLKPIGYEAHHTRQVQPSAHSESSGSSNVSLRFPSRQMGRALNHASPPFHFDTASANCSSLFLMHRQRLPRKTLIGPRICLPLRPSQIFIRKWPIPFKIFLRRIARLPDGPSHMTLTINLKGIYFASQKQRIRAELFTSLKLLSLSAVEKPQFDKAPKGCVRPLRA